MPAIGTANVRYLTIWVTAGGYRRFSSHAAREDAERSMREAVKREPIWATIIRFNTETLEASVLRYHQDRS